MRFHNQRPGRGSGCRPGRGPHGGAGRGFSSGFAGLGRYFDFDYTRRFRQGRGGRGLYRARDGMILGVCKGLARYFDLSVRWTRIIAFAAFLLTGIWPALILYVVLALVMKPAPVVAPASEDEAEFYESYASSRSMALGRLKRTYERLERRLRRLEDAVTSPEFHWDERAR